MPLGIMDWDLRENGGELARDRGWTLVLLYWHSNGHGRAWPNVNTLCKEIGCASEKADRVIDWLIEHGAVMKVPVEKREMDEKHLNKRKTVYQLTGIIKIGEAWRRYVCGLNPETERTLRYLVTSLCDSGSEQHRSIIEALLQTSFDYRMNNRSKIEFSKIENEGIPSSSEGIPKKGSSKKGTRTAASKEVKAGSPKPLVPEDPPPYAGQPPARVAEVDEAHQRTWDGALNQLAYQMDKSAYNTWLKDLKLAAVEGSVFVLAARNQHVVDACEGQFYKSVRRLLRDCGGGPETDVRFVMTPGAEGT